MNELDKLIEDYQNNRKKIFKMIEKLEEHLDIVDSEMKSAKKNFRTSNYVFDTKLKMITEYFKLILDMRKEISKSIKDEFVLRRQLGDGEEDIDDIHRFLKKLGANIDLKKLELN